MDFIDFEATIASDKKVGSEDEASDIDSLKPFIDDKTEIKKDRTCYYKFENATKSIYETLAEVFDESMRNIEHLNEVSNFCKGSEEEGEIDEFKDVEKRIEKFEETLHPSVAGWWGRSNQFFCPCYFIRAEAWRFWKTCNDKELQETIRIYFWNCLWTETGFG